MKILGGREMLKVDKTKLLFQYWRSTEACRAVLKEPTVETIIEIIKDELETFEWRLHHLSFYIYYGTNSYMGEPFEDESEEDYVPGTSATDVNIVGDAGPHETLWFVFEREEWGWLEEQTGIEFELILSKDWQSWIDDFEGNRHHDWVLNVWNQDYLLDVRDITEANIEIVLK